jgi:hypothetical protein
VLFDQIEDGLDFADAGSHPNTPELIVMTGQQLIQETGMFPDDLKAWKRLPTPDRTWARFKSDFTMAHQELRENNSSDAGVFSQANNAAIALRDEEITEAMANPATATAADRTANAALTQTVADLTAQLAEANTQLAKVTAQLIKANNTGPTSGRNGGAAQPRNTPGSHIGGPTGRHYCWSCGAFCYHSGRDCRTKKDGHKDEATKHNKMDGSTHSFA